jgi:hypothetical protein
METLPFLEFTDNYQKQLAQFTKENTPIAIGLTGIYFGYVALGGIDHNLHKHVYTGNENDNVWTRLKQGKPVTFSEDVYDEFFSFKHYFTTYRIHVLTAATWLITGVYNLRNPPTFVGKDSNSGKMLFDGWYHRRLSGYLYAITSFAKGTTASALSIRSHSLGFARWPMALCGIYDVISLGIALNYAVNGNPVEHKKWMIRNFGVGAGSIWVRVFAAAWAATDLSFMSNADFYREMNNVALCVGFLQGILFSEWWVATDFITRRKWFLAQLINVVFGLIGYRHVYRQLRLKRINLALNRGVDKELILLGEEFKSM